MDLEQKYKEKTGFDVGKIHDTGTTYFSNDYVEWLKKQLKSSVDPLKGEGSMTFKEWYTDNEYHKTMTGDFIKDGVRMSLNELIYIYNRNHLKMY